MIIFLYGALPRNYEVQEEEATHLFFHSQCTNLKPLVGQGILHPVV